MRDTDIDFMDFQSAREYVLAFITTLKKTQKQRAVAEEELEHWRGRVKLAESRGEPVLKRGAEQRVAELEAQSQQLLQEELELKRKVDVLKEKLKATKIRSSLQVAADALLAQMQMLVGEPDRLKEDLRSTEADQALQELKKKMKEGEDR
jgi:phage shock protein A